MEEGVATCMGVAVCMPEPGEPLSRALAVVLCDGEGQGEGCKGKGEPDCVREPPTAGESKVSVGVAEPSMDDFADALGTRLVVPVSPP